MSVATTVRETDPRAHVDVANRMESELFGTKSLHIARFGDARCAGDPEVLGIIEGPELACSFLSQERPFPYDGARSVDKLKGGDVADLIGTARSFGAACMW